jgi:hypothetical protein
MLGITMSRYAFFWRDGGCGGGRSRGWGHPIPDPLLPPPAQPVGASLAVDQEPVPITQSELRRNVVCT